MIRIRNNLGSAFAGAAAVVIILAVLLPFYMLFKVDYAPTLASNAIIEFTAPDTAVALQNTLGALSFPFALMGGIMLIAMIGLPVGLVFAAIRSRSAPGAVTVASLLMPVLVWFCYPAHMTFVALAPLLATGPLIFVLARRDPRLAASAEGISRREVLKRAAIFSVGGLLLSIIDSFPVYQSALNAARAGKRLFDFAPPAPRAAGFPVPDAVPEITPVEDFYVMRKFPTVVPPAPPDWKLVVDGLVEHPLALSFEDILAFACQDTFITRQCISNAVGGNLISSALFSGTRLTDVMAKAGIKPGAIQLKFYGRDGYDESVPVAHALDYGLLAYAMNGLFLSDAHGAPLKVEVPGLYGFKNMKWLTRIEAVGEPYQSVWTREGWTETAICKTMSRIDSAALNPEGGSTLAGIAFAGLRDIQKVEVQVNSGPWQSAGLNVPPLSDRTWVQWRLDIPQRGQLNVTVRAVDGTGAPQIETRQQQFPDGASGLHNAVFNL